MAVLEEGLLQGQYERIAEAANILVPLTVSTPSTFPTDDLSILDDLVFGAHKRGVMDSFSTNRA